MITTDRAGDAPDEFRAGEPSVRMEVFLTNPLEQPDMSQWDTDLVFRLAD